MFVKLRQLALRFCDLKFDTGVALACLILSLFFIVLLYGYSHTGKKFSYNIYTDREVVRSLELNKEFQFLGAEVGGDKCPRSPGGMLYYLTSIPLFFNNDPVAVNLFAFLLNICALLLVVFTLKKFYGILPSLVSCVILLLSPFYTNNSNLYSNISFPFLAIAFVFGVKIIKERNIVFFRWIILFALVALQIFPVTGSFLFSAIIFFVVLGGINLKKIIEKKKQIIREGKIGVIIILILFAPYIVGEYIHHFTNLSLLLHNNVAASDDYRNIYRFSGFIGKFEMIQKASWNFKLNNLHNGVSLSIGIFSKWFILLLVCTFMFLSFISYLKLKEARFFYPIKSCDRQVILFCTLQMICLMFMVPFSLLENWGIVAISFSVLVGIAVFYIMSLFTNALQKALAYFFLCLLILSIGPRFLQAYKEINDQKSIFSYYRLNVLLARIEKESGWSIQKIMGSSMIWVYGMDKEHHLILNGANNYIKASYQLAKRKEEFKGEKDSIGVIYVINNSKGKYCDTLSNNHIKECLKNSFYINSFEDPYRILRNEIKGIDSIIPDMQIIKQIRYKDNDMLVFYRRYDNGKALTNLSNQCIFNNYEKKMYKMYAKRVLSRQSNHCVLYENGAFYFNPLGNLFLALTITNDSSEIHSELQSNQLRANSQNEGFYKSYSVKKPRILLRNIANGKENVLFLSQGMVGSFIGESTPVRSKATKPEKGLYNVFFIAELFNMQANSHLSWIPINVNIGEYKVNN